MGSVRWFQRTVVIRTVAVAVIVSLTVGLLSHGFAAALAAVVGSSIGLTYLLHIARGFDRLVKGGKRFIPFTIVESLLRIFIVGVAPFVIFRHGPALAYIVYVAGFVAPLAVAIITAAQQNKTSSATTGTP